MCEIYSSFLLVIPQKALGFHMQERKKPTNTKGKLPQASSGARLPPMKLYAWRDLLNQWLAWYSISLISLQEWANTVSLSRT